MTLYAGLDISNKNKHVCMVEATGADTWPRGVCAADPQAVAATLARMLLDWSVWCWRRARCRRSSIMVWSSVTYR